VVTSFTEAGKRRKVGGTEVLEEDMLAENICEVGA